MKRTGRQNGREPGGRTGGSQEAGLKGARMQNLNSDFFVVFVI
jgi:hypothetical protein